MTTENMGLTYVESGESQYVWGTVWNSNFNIVDAHDHSYGNGIQINLSNVNIINSFSSNTYYYNISSLSLSDNNFSGVSQSIYNSGGDFYYLDKDFRSVQITSGSSLNYGSIVGEGFSGVYGDFGNGYYTQSTEDYSFLDLSNELCTILCPILNTEELNSIDINYSDSFTCNCSYTAMTFNFPVSTYSVTVDYDSGTEEFSISSSSTVAQIYIPGESTADSLIRNSMRYAASLTDYNRADESYAILFNSQGYNYGSVTSTGSTVTVYVNIVCIYYSIYSINNIAISGPGLSSTYFGVTDYVPTTSAWYFYTPSSSGSYSESISAYPSCPQYVLDSAGTYVETVYFPTSTSETNFVLDCIFNMVGG